MVKLRRSIQKIEIWFRRNILKQRVIEIPVSSKELQEAFTSRESFHKFLDTIYDKAGKEIKKGGDSNI